MPSIKDVPMKVWLFLFYTVVLVVVSMWLGYSVKNSDYEEIIRQKDGQLTQKERDLLEANKEMGRLAGQVASKEELVQKYREIFKDDRDIIDRMMKDYNMRIDSMSHVIATLSGKIEGEGGTSTATPVGDTFKFEWSDKLNRFHLYTPNIKDKNAAIFTYDQKFAIEVLGLKQDPKSGALQAQIVNLYEIDKDKNRIKKADVDLDASKFEFEIYVPPDENKKATQTFLLGLTHGAEVSVGWEPMRFKNQIGVAGFAFGNGERQGVGLGVTYYPVLVKIKSQVGIGALVGYTTDNEAVIRAYVAIGIASK